MNDRTENSDPGGPPRVRGARPWTRLPSEVHAVVAPLLPRISDETVQTIGREIPAYTRPLEGEFGDVVRTGVEQALVQFAEMIRDRQRRCPKRAARVYVALGRGELRAGRSIGALLAAYRIGAQVAWRHLGRRRPAGRFGAARIEPARRVDLRLHRRALGRLGRGLRAGAGRPAPASSIARAAS